MGKRRAAESLLGGGGGAAGGGDVLPDDAVDLPRRPLRPHRLRADADGERGAAQLRRNRLVKEAAQRDSLHPAPTPIPQILLKPFVKFACG